MSETTMTDLAELGAATAEAPVLAEPKIDSLGRSYATGRRKEAVARVWVKPELAPLPLTVRMLASTLRALCCA